MSLFRYAENLSEDENHTEAQIQKKRIRMKMNRSENDPVFKGKVNLSLDALQNAEEELWLVKLPKNFRAERMEGQEIELKNDSETPLQLKTNGAIQNATVIENTFSLPFVCPQKDKKRVSVRKKHGLQAEKAIQNRDETIQDLEEDADTVSLQFKGKIVLLRHVETGEVPKPMPEEIERIPQPILKRRHPFFGVQEPSRDTGETKEVPENIVVEKKSKKRKKSTK